MVDLTVAIATTNNLQMLSDLIDTIRKKTRKISYRLLVIDNGSTDGTLDYLTGLKPGPVVIRNREFPGFAACHNQALEFADGRYHLLLNDDTLLISHVFDEIVELMDANPEVGLAGVRLLNDDGSLQVSAYESYSGLLTELREALLINAVLRRLKVKSQTDYFGRGVKDPGRPVDVAHLAGAFLIIRREVIDRVGPLDEEFFLTFEDQDYCRRVREAGYRVCYFPAPRILHFGNRSVRRDSERSVRTFYTSRLRFHRKYHGLLSARILLAIMAVGFGLKLTLTTARSLKNAEDPRNDRDLRTAWYGLSVLKTFPAIRRAMAKERGEGSRPVSRKAGRRRKE